MAVSAVVRGLWRGVDVMSDAKHTPGPWEACDAGDYSDYDGKCRVILGDDLRIAVALGDHAENDANARLIAAAPDLLAALEVALFWLEYDGRYDVQGIRATIAKAKGSDT